MNKYQEVYERLTSEDYKYKDIESVYKDLEVLKSLVEKSTPKKPAFNKLFEDEETTSIYDEYSFIDPIVCVCPHCEGSGIYDFEYDVKFKHCTDCGGAIDWRDKE